jgi:predicted alpha/beta-hydrolase family hydrolase
MSEPFKNGSVTGFLHRAEGPDGIVLTHGAGGNCGMPLLVRAAEAFAAAGITALRCDLAFRQRRPKGSPSPAGAAADRAGLKNAVAALRGIVKGRVFLGGQCFGGRQATMLAAEEPELAGRLLLFSYPLHPPGKPEQLRTAHFPALRTPAIFVHGTKDPFGSIDEMRSALPIIPAHTELVVIEGAGHDLLRGRFDVEGVVSRFAG